MSAPRMPRPSRRAVLAGTASLAAGSALDVRAEMYTSAVPEDAGLEDFATAYQRGAIEPFERTRIYRGPGLTLPMIDREAFSKQGAIPPHIWGMLYDDWEPATEEEGVFLLMQGLENRGPDNARKRWYMTATTPDLYFAHYRPKVRRFLDRLFAPENAGKPLMRSYYDSYFDLHWDLHVGLLEDDVPQGIREYGHAFTNVLGFWDPHRDVVRENYRTVRARLPQVRTWIQDRVQDVMDDRIPNREGTFAHYWIVNGNFGSAFTKTDVVQECFHNFLALSQWGNMLYNVVAYLAVDNGNEEARSAYERTMSGAVEDEDGGPFNALDRLVMEFFRTISPNAGSVSTVADITRDGEITGRDFIRHPHLESSMDERNWEDPKSFAPERYRSVPLAHEIDEEYCRGAGLARCPFEPATWAVEDGRPVVLPSNGFGTVYGERAGTPFGLVEHAGHAPFGFGYRRCAGEWLTMEIFKDVLRKVHGDGIRFRSLGLESPERLPVAPAVTIEDGIGFEVG